MKSGYPQISIKKIFLLIAISAISFISKAQPIAAYADPAVGSFDISSTTDNPVPANTLLSNTVYKLKLVILNQDQVNGIPAGTCQIKIGLGSRLKLDPAYVLATSPYFNYFTWTSATVGGQVQIYGNLHTALPADFIGQLSFNVRAISPATQGTSTISANFLVTNDNPLINFSDLNPANNNASLQYTLAAQIPLPVTITQFGATNKDCKINVNWSTEQETNVSKYDVEMSKDGANYFFVTSVTAQSRTNYGAVINITDQIKNPVLFVRLKSVDLDGSFKYSNVIQVAGTCGGKNTTGIYSYPNPVIAGTSSISIATRGGVFNGAYQLTLSDISGRVYGSKEINLVNAVSFRYDVAPVLAPGKYFINILKVATGEKTLVQFEKL